MRTTRIALAATAAALLTLTATPALAQETADGLWLDGRVPPVLDLRGPSTLNDRPTPMLVDNGLPHLLLTGYWPPTNEMLRQWSTDPNQNPGVWVGENWEGRGYNVYAFFPEFPGGTDTNPKGDGDFEVDYQDTSADWWHLLPMVNPIAIITTSRANTTKGWELEGGNRFYLDSSWTNDYLVPYKPTANEPSDAPFTTRYSSQPIDDIIAAVETSGADVDPFSTTLDFSAFLSNYIGYHGNWWKDTHSDPNQPNFCYTGGHIHVGRYTVVAEAVHAMEVTIRVVATHTDRLRFDKDGSGQIDILDVEDFAGCMSGPDIVLFPPCAAADTDQDVDGDLRDIAGFQRTAGSL